MVTSTNQKMISRKQKPKTSTFRQIQDSITEPESDLEAMPGQPAYEAPVPVTAESLQRLPSQNLRIATFQNAQHWQGNRYAAQIARQLKETSAKSAPTTRNKGVIQRDLAFASDWNSGVLGSIFTNNQATTNKLKQDLNDLFKPLEDLLVEITTISQLKRSPFAARAKEVIAFIKAKQNPKKPTPWAEREQLKTDIEEQHTEAKNILSEYETSRSEGYGSQRDTNDSSAGQLGKKTAYLPLSLKTLREEAEELATSKDWDGADAKMKELTELISSVASFKAKYDSLNKKYNEAISDADYAPTILETTWTSAIETCKNGDPDSALDSLEGIEDLITTVAGSTLLVNVQSSYTTAHDLEDYCPGGLEELQAELPEATVSKTWNSKLHQLKALINKVIDLEKKVSALEERANKLSTDDDKNAILGKLTTFKSLDWEAMLESKLAPIQESLVTYEVVELNIADPIKTTHYKASRKKVERQRLQDIGLPKEEQTKVEYVLGKVGKGKPEGFGDSWKWADDYENRDNSLPALDGALTYKEYYVKPEKKSDGFGERRIVASSDGKRVYYSNNHYGSGNAATAFVCIKW